MGPNLGRHVLFCFQIPPHNAIKNEFSASLSMNFGKANVGNTTLVNPVLAIFFAAQLFLTHNVLRFVHMTKFVSKQ